MKDRKIGSLQSKNTMMMALSINNKNQSDEDFGSPARRVVEPSRSSFPSIMGYKKSTDVNKNDVSPNRVSPPSKVMSPQSRRFKNES